MQIGDEFVLVNHAPYGMFIGHNVEPIKAIMIKVLDSKDDVPGEFTGKPQGTGYLAIGSDGYYYGLNWRTYHEGFSDPCWVRWCPDDEFEKLSEEKKAAMIEDYLWMDVNRYQAPPTPKFVETYPFLKYCEKHQHLYYERTGCWRCKFKTKEMEVTLNREEHSWVGWYDDLKPADEPTEPAKEAVND